MAKCNTPKIMRRTRFLRLVVSKQHASKMPLPSKFVKKHRRSIPQSGFLLCHGISWPIKLSVKGEGINITERWVEFAKHYSLRKGDYLSFKFARKDIFYVAIYDTNCTEVNYGRRCKSMKQPLFQTKKKGKAKTTCPEGPEPVVIKDERIDPIEDMSVVSIFPEEHCILTVEERHVLADYGPFIPTAFSRANFGPKKHQCLKDMLFVVGDVVYTIKYKFVKGRGCRVEPRTGWREFASANKLLKGDGVFLRRFNPGLKTFAVDIIRG